MIKEGWNVSQEARKRQNGVFSVCGLGETCWWIVHPSSRQRSEGEKVRVGDDLILVNMSSERYLVSP